MSWCKKSCAWLSALLLSALFQSAVVLAADAESKPKDLVMLNWSEYLDPELIAAFEQKFNVNIREVYFETDDLRDDMLLETDGKGYDIVVVNGINVDMYRKRGWLAPLTDKQVPNMKHVDARWLDAFAGVSGYAVPYFWGTTGIAYREDLVGKQITSWMDLFRPAESMKGKIGMINNSRDTIGMALKALGYSANSTDPAELAAAEALLLEQKPGVHSYSYLSIGEDSGLLTGEIVAAMLYSGDSMSLTEENPEIRYVVPVEGGNIWVDYLVVPEGAQEKVLAWQFIDFLNEPENAAQLAEYVYYATPNKAAEKLLPAEFLEDPVMYPGAEVLEKSEYYVPLPARAVRKRNLINSRVTQ